MCRIVYFLCYIKTNIVSFGREGICKYIVLLCSVVRNGMFQDYAPCSVECNHMGS